MAERVGITFCYVALGSHRSHLILADRPQGVEFLSRASNRFEPEDNWIELSEKT